MTEHSKVAQELGVLPILQDLLIGTSKRKMVSATVLLIIAFLIHVKNKKSDLVLPRADRH